MSPFLELSGVVVLLAGLVRLWVLAREVVL